jgi:hypothetical protein
VVKGSLERTDTNRKISTTKAFMLKDEPIVFILNPVFSLRSLNQEFTRFEKKIIHGAIQEIETLCEHVLLFSSLPYFQFRQFRRFFLYMFFASPSPWL